VIISNNVECGSFSTNTQRIAVSRLDSAEKQCSDAKLDSILDEPYFENGQWHDTRERIDCSVTLPKGSIVKKRLQFDTSNVTFDCNGGAITPRAEVTTRSIRSS
jgi:hypothetical protein